MNNVRFFTDELDGSIHAIIDRGNGEFTSMPKSVYDQQQAAMTIAEDTNGNN